MKHYSISWQSIRTNRHLEQLLMPYLEHNSHYQLVQMTPDRGARTHWHLHIPQTDANIEFVILSAPGTWV